MLCFLTEPLVREHPQFPRQRAVRAVLALVGDSHYRVAQLAQEGLCALFEAHSASMETHLEETLAPVVSNIAEKRESLSVGANDLLGVLQRAYGADRLVPLLLRLLDIREKMKTKTTAVEVLTVLLAQSRLFCA